jgi:IclR family acetate operon transcriptional repressor
MWRVTLAGTQGASADRDGREAKSMLARALDVLDVFDSAHSELRLTQIARRAGLPLSTAHRIVGELVAWGGLERNENRYRIGLRIFELGTIAPSWEQRRNAALPYMQDLYEATHESIHLATLDGTEIVYLLKISGHQPTAPTRTGGRSPAHCTSLGKVMLAFSPEPAQEIVLESALEPVTPHTIVDADDFRRELADIRQKGVAFDRQESASGLGGVAAPIFGPEGSQVGAVSVSAPYRRINTVALSPAVRAAALGISRALS